MPDVFISYAREDQSFVRKLHAALNDQGRDSWVDWEDILPTARWRKEINEAIEGSDYLVFVVSPDSIDSRTCREEIGHAADHNKRLVPIVRREVVGARVPDPVAAHNWIFFRDHDEG